MRLAKLQGTLLFQIIIWPASTIGVFVVKEHPRTDKAAATDIH